MAEHQMTTTRVQAMKRRTEKIVMVTAYDYPTASLVDEAGGDLVLVGASMGMAVLVETVAKTDSTLAAGGDRNWKLSGASTRASTESGDKES